MTGSVGHGASVSRRCKVRGVAPAIISATFSALRRSVCCTSKPRTVAHLITQVSPDPASCGPGTLVPGGCEPDGPCIGGAEPGAVVLKDAGPRGLAHELAEVPGQAPGLLGPHMRREKIGQLGFTALVQQGVDVPDVDGFGERLLALRFGDDRGPANDEIHRD